ncbi:MAG: CoA transferase [Candidatus Marsarchaeota archaeon]|nr:CoA transferase [Candidatus Marsarchaeota archaeon]
MPGSVEQNSAPLSGLRALDLTGELGWLLGRILADVGVEVRKLDPPGGDPGRNLAPVIEGPAGAISAAWVAYNMGKSRLDLDLGTSDGRELFLDLASEVDFVFESEEPGILDSLGIGWYELHKRNPALILTSVTPYGQDGPLAGTPASDMELMSAGGAVWLTGDADRPPVRMTLPQSICWAGSYAAVGTMIAHHHRQLTGQGQHVDMSAQAGLLPALVHAPSFFDLLGENPLRAGGYLVGRNINGAAMRNIWPCRDGYVTWAIYGGAAGRQSNRGMVEWMDDKGMAPEYLKNMDWSTFDVATVTLAEVSEMESAIAAFLETVTKAEFLQQADVRRMLGYVVSTAADIAVDEQLRKREVWSEEFVPELGQPLRFPDGWLRIDGCRQGVALPVSGGEK